MSGFIFFIKFEQKALIYTKVVQIIEQISKVENELNSNKLYFKENVLLFCPFEE
jgi:hypothetical protein